MHDPEALPAIGSRCRLCSISPCPRLRAKLPCLTSEKYKAEIDQDLCEGMQAGINGTPGFFINGVALSGSQPKESFAQIIDEELARK